jgi:hypothetical protein
MHVSLLPFVSESSRWRPVYGAHINMCFQLALLRKHEAKRKHESPMPPVRQSAACKYRLLHDQVYKTPSLQKTKNHITMSSQKHQYRPPDLPDPKPPSRQLKVVLDYLDNVKRWDFDALSKQFTSHFTLQILPASLHLSPRTNSEYIDSLRDPLNGAPLAVCFRLYLWLAQGLFITHQSFANPRRCS